MNKEPFNGVTPKQYQAIKMMVYENATKVEIADKLKVTTRQIYNWTQKKEFQQALKEEIDRSLGNLVPKAINRLSLLIDSKQESIALGAIKEVLNKAGYKETEKIEHQITKIDLTIEDDDD